MLEHIKYDIKHFNNFQKHLPNQKALCQKTVAKLLKLGMIQVSTAFEHALAKVGKLQVVSESGHDISDGSDAKLVTVRFRASRTAYDAHVSNTKNKTGKLRVHVYEKQQNKFYYFVIPYYAHSTVTYLEIPFHLDGTPKRVTYNGKANKWWEYEVDNFYELATA